MSADGTAPAFFLTDSFAGIGGASFGIKLATGQDVNVAVNHWDVAVMMHGLNHKLTQHHCEDIYKVDPLVVCGGNAIDLAWFSPTCTDFSRAKGDKPIDNKLRALPWIVNEWCRRNPPRIFVMENVPEIADWAPLNAKGERIKERKGEVFQAWLTDLRNLGYKVEVKKLKAHHFGSPTSRERLFVIGRRDGLPIQWPAPTHGAAPLLPFKTAASCIDWSIPSLSIFATREEARAFAKKYGCGVPRRPLKPKTLARIVKGLRKFVLDAKRPFIVPVTHGGDTRVHSVDDPFRTITGAHRGEYGVAVPFISKLQQNSIGQDLGDPLHTAMAGAQRFGVVSPLLVQTGYSERKANSYGRKKGQDVRVLDIGEPLGTVVGGGQRHGLASVVLERAGIRLADAAFIARNFSDRAGGWAGGESVDGPLSTITARDHHSVVTANLVELKGNGADAFRGGTAVDEPLGSICAQGNHWAEVRALLVKYYGEGGPSDVAEPLDTVTSKGRFGLAPVTVAIDGDEYVIVDIGFRMLTPRELARAQGFPDSYHLELGADGKKLTTEDQVRLIGNSVPPQVAAAIVRANLYGDNVEVRRAA